MRVSWVVALERRPRGLTFAVRCPLLLLLLLLCCKRGHAAVLECHRGLTSDDQPRACACAADCLTCDYTGFSTGPCLVCTNSRFLRNGACVRTCPVGMTADGAEVVGRKCQPSGDPTAAPTTGFITTNLPTTAAFVPVADPTAADVQAVALCALRLLAAVAQSPARPFLRGVLDALTQPTTGGTNFEFIFDVAATNCSAAAPPAAVCVVCRVGMAGRGACSLGLWLWCACRRTRQARLGAGSCRCLCPFPARANITTAARTLFWWKIHPVLRRRHRPPHLRQLNHRHPPQHKQRHPQQ